MRLGQVGWIASFILNAHLQPGTLEPPSPTPTPQRWLLLECYSPFRYHCDECNAVTFVMVARKNPSSIIRKRPSHSKSSATKVSRRRRKLYHHTSFIVKQPSDSKSSATKVSRRRRKLYHNVTPKTVTPTSPPVKVSSKCVKRCAFLGCNLSPHKGSCVARCAAPNGPAGEKFCVGCEGALIYCYGSPFGCLWGK